MYRTRNGRLEDFREYADFVETVVERHNSLLLLPKPAYYTYTHVVFVDGAQQQRDAYMERW